MVVEVGSEEVDKAVCGRGGAHIAELTSVNAGREVLVSPVNYEASTLQAEQ